MDLSLIKAAVFDMDGTLTDSMFIWDTLGSDYLRRYGIEPPEGLDARYRKLTTPGAAALLHDCGVPRSPEQIIEDISEMVGGFYRSEVEPKPGALPFLARLRALGIPMCVATANERPMAEAALNRCGILPYIGLLLTCTEAGTDKNDPEFYRIAADRLGVPAGDVWVFEDVLHAVRSAKAAGAHTVGVYDPTSIKYCPTLPDEADIFIRCYEDL